MAIWYWHFVDVVWILVFFSLYWWGNDDFSYATDFDIKYFSEGANVNINYIYEKNNFDPYYMEINPSLSSYSKDFLKLNPFQFAGSECYNMTNNSLEKIVINLWA